MFRSKRNVLLLILASAAAFIATSAIVRGSRVLVESPTSVLAAQQAPMKKHYLLMVNNEVKAGKAKASDEEFKRLIGEHFGQMKKHFAEGKVILAGPRLDEVQGIVILEVSSLEEAEVIAKNDACVKAGVFRYELHELHIALQRGVTPVQ
jgi:uncharacterized protein YciI